MYKEENKLPCPTAFPEVSRLYDDTIEVGMIYALEAVIGEFQRSKEFQEYTLKHSKISKKETERQKLIIALYSGWIDHFETLRHVSIIDLKHLESDSPHNLSSPVAIGYGVAA